jgi:hypothetical protein
MAASTQDFQNSNSTAEVQHEETRRFVSGVARGATRVITKPQHKWSIDGALNVNTGNGPWRESDITWAANYYRRPFWWRYLPNLPRLAVSLRTREEVMNGGPEARGKEADADVLPSEQPFWQQCIFLWRYRVEELWIVAEETGWQTSQYRLCSTDGRLGKNT